MAMRGATGFSGSAASIFATTSVNHRLPNRQQQANVVDVVADSIDADDRILKTEELPRFAGCHATEDSGGFTTIALVEDSRADHLGDALTHPELDVIFLRLNDRDQGTISSNFSTLSRAKSMYAMLGLYSPLRQAGETERKLGQRSRHSLDCLDVSVAYDTPFIQTASRRRRLGHWPGSTGSF
jgi:hypothetical protein